jgi:hypothetical protein
MTINIEFSIYLNFINIILKNESDNTFILPKSILYFGIILF